MGAKTAERAGKAFGAITPLLGLGAVVGGAVGGLKKPNQVNASSSNTQLGGLMSGVAAQGAGENRAGNFLQALRSGSRAAGPLFAQNDSARVAAQIGNEQSRVGRAERATVFGKDLGASAGVLGAGLVESANARKDERAKEDADALEKRDADRAAALATEDASHQESLGIQQQAVAGLVRFENFKRQLDGQAPVRGLDEVPSLEEIVDNPYSTAQDILDSVKQEGAELEQKEIRSLYDAHDAIKANHGLPVNDELKQIAAPIAYRFSRFNFALDEANRRGMQLATAAPFLARSIGIPLEELQQRESGEEA